MGRTLSSLHILQPLLYRSLPLPHQVLQEMLDHIDRQQRNKLKLDNLSIPSPPHRPLRHQFSSDNMHVPPFNIPNLRIDQRKTSSAEDMARKNSTGSGIMGGWWFGASPSSPDSNFLRVGNAFPNRRLSDNTLMTPKIRIAPSCASSPGGTPGSGLPIRRHSSIGPQERRSSAMNLSPPTVSIIGYCWTWDCGDGFKICKAELLVSWREGGGINRWNSTLNYYFLRPMKLAMKMVILSKFCCLLFGSLPEITMKVSCVHYFLFWELQLFLDEVIKAKNVELNI